MSEEPRKSKWGIGAAAIYVSFVLFILSLVLYASLQDFQLTEVGAYERGLDYQERIDRLQRSNDLVHGMSIAHQYAEERILLSLETANSAEVSGVIRMTRPSNARLDREWSLSLDENGQQVVSTEGMARGQWNMEVDWSLDSTQYIDETRIVIP